MKTTISPLALFPGVLLRFLLPCFGLWTLAAILPLRAEPATAPAAGTATAKPESLPVTPPTAIRVENFTDFSGYRVGQVAQPVISLNGRWEVALASARDVLAGASSLRWYPVAVPGEVLMQGVPAKPDVPFSYRHTFVVPADFRDCRILLCFDGVYSDTRVFVKGRELGSHAGGFTPWAVDLTSHVQPGETVQLVVQVTDRHNEVSYGSGYAKHSIAGILRNVRLRADPAQRVEDWRTVTTVDTARGTAELHLDFALSLTQVAELRVQLTDPTGRTVDVPTPAQSLAAEAKSAAWHITLAQPQLWTAETPALYTLDVALVAQGKTLQSFSHKIGVRQIEVKGERVLVNGLPVKLRGACRHDMHPLLGRVSTPDYEEKDVMLAKEANLNFIRTSHYPPTRHFLELCDRYGLYVEVETAVCFLKTHRSPTDQKIPHTGPEFREQMLQQIRAMERDARNHASVLLWSVGNESDYDDNIQASYDYLKATDPSRPVIFSYPGKVPAGHRVYDLASLHYPNVMENGRTKNFAFVSTDWRVPGFPALFDEWAHLACYAKPELIEDPNMRDFWAPSIDRMWRAVLAEPGALGGALWGMIDETFALPIDLPGRGEWWGHESPEFAPFDYAGPTIGYGEWGFIDVWRRKKPEFWHVQKAHSPIRFKVREVTRDVTNGDAIIPIENRHDHLDLSSLRLRWSRSDATGEMPLPTLVPHSRGSLRLPASVLGSNGEIRLQAVSADNRVIDEEILNLTLSAANTAASAPSAPAGHLHWEETTAERLLRGPGFSLRFARDTGLLIEALVAEVPVLRGGPWLTFRAAEPSKKRRGISEFPELAQNWQLQSWEHDLVDDQAHVRLVGVVGQNQPVEFKLTIFADGKMAIAYRAPSLSKGLVREAGVVFGVSADFTSVAWERDAYWTAYPADHPSRGRGTELLRNSTPLVYREEPRQSWWHDQKNFFLLGLEHPSYEFGLTAVARSTRENLRRLALCSAEGRERLVVIGNGTIAARLEQTGPKMIRLRLLQYWDYPNLLWGNIMKKISLTDDLTGEFTLELVLPK